MRPLRLVLLLSCFVALPILLTCLSLFTVHENAVDTFSSENDPSSNRLRALFSFRTPSSLFPPSAIISLTYDNSTFFLARPAAFGPLLPSKGINGQLWVGRGFGDAILSKDGSLQVNGWELGCSDVPGWTDGSQKQSDRSGNHGRPRAKSVTDKNLGPMDTDQSEELPKSDKTPDSEQDLVHEDSSNPDYDGTDDHLHYPLPDSNPAKPGQPGEPATADTSGDKSRKPTHADIESLQESADIAGKIVLLSRGGCGFLEKVKWAQRRGGIAVVVGDNEQGAPLTIMYAKGDTSNVTIPAIFTSYTSAHLLSSLVPLEQDDKEPDRITGGSSDVKKGKPRAKDSGPTFTSLKSSASSVSSSRPAIISAKSKQASVDQKKGWAQNMLSAVGLREESSRLVEDSRRPPSSGNIDWVLVEDWDDEDKKHKTAKGKPVSAKSRASSVTLPKPTSPSGRRPSGDDFVIGVQDWRDTDLVAPKPTPPSERDKQGKERKASGDQQSSSLVQAAHAAQTSGLKGGSITPGSGEYDDQKQDESKTRNTGHLEKSSKQPHAVSEPLHQHSWIKFWHWGHRQHSEDRVLQHSGRPETADHKATNSKGDQNNLETISHEHHGLWITLTPTSVSTSPFFDTLLVLVVSPLVTLTVVYALLLLRSRIRRRRWRAPKSVVERLPVRTYHTMSTSSSTTSSHVSSRNNSSPTTPLLPSSPQDVHSRSRPRSQTTTGIITSTSAGSSLAQSPRVPTAEKSHQKSETTKRKRYAGRQIECVVCLEEYVDGESRVMSLPCGHEFHADCITPWLVTRRRTCPICKGDVVRSMARNGSQQQEEDRREEGEETSDDVQDRVAETVNDNPSAAIPIPVREDEATEDVEGDVERGEAEHERQTRAGPGSGWRNIFSNSVNALSGETVWRSTPVDRSR